MLPAELPIFPLPNVVLFPHVFLPLHIFEPRYKAMVGDALRSHRLIGMVLLQDGWQGNYLGQPRVFDVGCAGVITHADRLEDGRYNVVLKGVQRFRIESERLQNDYRLARVTPIQDGTGDTVDLQTMRARLETLLAPLLREQPARLPGVTSARDLVHALAQHLDLAPVERQALLELGTIGERARSLVELVEMKLLESQQPSPTDRVH
jgi:hypothetical protein